MQAVSKEKLTFLLFSYKDSFLKQIARTFFSFENNNNDLQNALW